MSAIYVLGGCILVALGLCDSVRIIHKLINEGSGILDAKIKILGADIMCIILGIALIIH